MNSNHHFFALIRHWHAFLLQQHTRTVANRHHGLVPALNHVVLLRQVGSIVVPLDIFVLFLYRRMDLLDGARN